MNRGGKPRARESEEKTRGKREQSCGRGTRQDGKKGRRGIIPGGGGARVLQRAAAEDPGPLPLYKVAKATALPRARRIDVSSRALIGCDAAVSGGAAEEQL